MMTREKMREIQRQSKRGTMTLMPIAGGTQAANENRKRMVELAAHNLLATGAGPDGWHKSMAPLDTDEKKQARARAREIVREYEEEQVKAAEKMS